jgi:phosphatidylserine/phosphatidylglycerophosphate/cardiolipin synthase-like enzyme
MQPFGFSSPGKPSEKSIDLQYFFMKNDTAGAVMANALLNAARELSGNENDPDALTLHTKAILIDHRYMFIGSLNLDPRSIEINSEMGLLIDSESMSRDFTTNGDERMATLAQGVLENDAGRLEWHARPDRKPRCDRDQGTVDGLVAPFQGLVYENRS